jgi:hypothetical protein
LKEATLNVVDGTRGLGEVPFWHAETQMALHPAVFKHVKTGPTDLVLRSEHAVLKDIDEVGAAVDVVGAWVLLAEQIWASASRSADVVQAAQTAAGAARAARANFMLGGTTQR